jgi:hypothetical protein
MSSSVIEVRRHFDAIAWQVAASRAPASATFLVTWTVMPEPVDAGIPSSVRDVLAEALCAVGSCWFAGDEDSGVPVTTVRLRRALSLRTAPIFRVDRAEGLRPAFESGAHDWSMAAQWIVVAAGDGERARVIDVLRTLLEDWNLPGDWPPDVSAIIQAGVDGDAAGCHCRTQEIAGQLRDALERHGATHGIDVRAVD